MLKLQIRHDFKAMKLYIKREIEEKKKSAPLLRFQPFHVDLD